MNNTITRLRVNGLWELRVHLMSVWQASHGRWGPTAASSTKTNRRNPFCSSTGAGTQWVYNACASCSLHLTKGVLVQYGHALRNRLTGRITLLSLFLFLTVARTTWSAAISTSSWRFCPWRCSSSSSEWPTSTSFSWWCCRSVEALLLPLPLSLLHRVSNI